MTLQAKHLAAKIESIDRKSYKAYQDLAGSYEFPDFQLFLDHIQGDPFASPTSIRVRALRERNGIPARLFRSRERRVAACDYIARQVARSIRRRVKGNRGTGHSGLIDIDQGGQEVLERTAVFLNQDWVEARMVLGLPAAGRTVLGNEARAMLLEELPDVARDSLFMNSIDAQAFEAHVLLAEDQEFIRRELPGQGLVAFIGKGAILPRQSGVSNAPMSAKLAVPFVPASSLGVSFDTPNRGTVEGMGIPRGVTLIAGGGYHGKSTLLRALERGVYNHMPGDGREMVLTIPEAVKIRAEDGRRVEKVDISPFIKNLPFGQKTDRFSTEEASGSTSQAANIIEALEMGAQLLLIDEDTSATNFMVRDVRMQQLVAQGKEPITPFIDKVRQLYEELGVSSILVGGGSGDYFDLADTVIVMEECQPREATARAREIAWQYQTKRRMEGGDCFGTVRARIPLAASFNPVRNGRVKVEARDLSSIRFGEENILMGQVEQLVDPSQARAIAAAMLYLSRKVEGGLSLRKAIHQVMSDIGRHGLEVLSPFPGSPPANYALPRTFELAAAINRLRSLKVKMVDE